MGMRRKLLSPFPSRSIETLTAVVLQVYEISRRMDETYGTSVPLPLFMKLKLRRHVICSDRLVAKSTKEAATPSGR